MVTPKYVAGDLVLAKDGAGFMTQMEVEGVGYTEAGKLVVTCAWPVFKNGDQPLYRRQFEAEELTPIFGKTDFYALPSKRPPEPDDMRAMRRVEPLQFTVSTPGTALYINGQVVHIKPAAPGDKPGWRLTALSPCISPEALDQMERAWTPAQVRALIADYRKLAGYTP